MPWHIFDKERLGKISSFSFKKMVFFSLKKYSYRIFLVQIWNQRTKIDPCAEFQPIWTKDKGSSNFDLERYRHTYLIVMMSAKLLSILRDFFQSTIMPRLVVLGPQIKEKQIDF